MHIENQSFVRNLAADASIFLKGDDMRRWCLFAVLTVAILASAIVAQTTTPYFTSKYGIDPVIVGLMFVVAELLFDLSLVSLLWFSGIRKITWQTIKTFRIRDFRLNVHNPAAIASLLVNRLAWISPFAYVLYASWGKLPVVAGLLIATEITLTLLAGLAVFGLFGPVKHRIRIRPAVQRDLDAIVRVDGEAWGKIFPGNREMFVSRIATFPEAGILVAEVDGVVEATLSTELVECLDTQNPPSWDEITDYGTIRRTHKPDGEWIYGVGLAATSKGSAHKAVSPLLQYLGRYAVASNKQGAIFAARIPGYHRVANKMTPEEYAAMKRSDGSPADPELRLYHKYGIKLIEPVVVARDYMDGSDEASGGFGVLVQWQNPFYNWPLPKLWSLLLKV